MSEIKLPSGAVLRTSPAPFADSKALYQAFLKEAKGISFTKNSEVSALLKDVLCIGFSSPQIEEALWKCMGRCTYNELKIDQDTFENVKNREDYMKVCIEVAKENISPFMKSLYADYKDFMQMVENTPA